MTEKSNLGSGYGCLVALILIPIFFWNFAFVTVDNAFCFCMKRSGGFQGTFEKIESHDNLILDVIEGLAFTVQYRPLLLIGENGIEYVGP